MGSSSQTKRKERKIQYYKIYLYLTIKWTTNKTNMQLIQFWLLGFLTMKAKHKSVGHLLSNNISDYKDKDNYKVINI